jgi:hypothetical protein
MPGHYSHSHFSFSFIFFLRTSGRCSWWLSTFLYFLLFSLQLLVHCLLPSLNLKHLSQPHSQLSTQLRKQTIRRELQVHLPAHLTLVSSPALVCSAISSVTKPSPISGKLLCSSSRSWSFQYAQLLLQQSFHHSYHHSFPFYQIILIAYRSCSIAVIYPFFKCLSLDFF